MLDTANILFHNYIEDRKVTCNFDIPEPLFKL